MSQIQQLITENIDLWSRAQLRKKPGGRGKRNSKTQHHGIQKLRELILELAVRGKLVPQDSNDEPVSVLLQNIAIEKARLVKEKKIKKPKPLPEISDEEKPFVLPQGWVWVRLGIITNYGVTDKAEPNNVTPDMWVLELEDVEKVTSKLITKQRFREREFKSSKNRFLKGDVIYGKLRPYLDKVLVADEDGVCTTEMIPVRGYSGIYPEFLRLVMKSPRFIEYANSSTHGMNLPRLGTDKARLAVIPLIPAKEQHRIVAKVDELMALCDQLEQQQGQQQQTQQTLVSTVLNAIVDATATDDGRGENATAIFFEHFDTLFTTEQSIDQLKQTLLQLAVMGKLVPQDPFDEPASQLLEKIAQQKARLIQEKKIKKQKPLAKISDEEKPFVLPVGWEWVRLQEITSKITDGDHKTPPRIDTGMRMLSAKNVRDGYVDFDNCDHISVDDYTKSRERCLPAPGDLLIVSVGGTIGRSSLVPQDSDFSLVRSVALIKPLLFNSKYLKYSADSPLLQNSIHSNKRGGAQPCLYLSEISKFPFPLPPLAEQHRIVAKIDQLMTLCDQLKTRLQQAQTSQQHLADAIVEQAVG